MNATLEATLYSNGHANHHGARLQSSVDFSPSNLTEMGKAARVASRQLVLLNTAQKNAALYAVAEELERQADVVIAQNELDMADGRAKGLADAFLARMLLNPKVIHAMVEDIRRVASLPDPNR